MIRCPTCGRHETAGDRCAVCAGYVDAWERLDRVHRTSGTWCHQCGWVLTNNHTCSTCQNQLPRPTGMPWPSWEHAAEDEPEPELLP